MTVNKPAIGDSNWGGPLNAALDSIDTRVTSLENVDTSLIKAGHWNYPSEAGVVIQTTQHNESIAVKSNQSAALRWHIRDDGSFVGTDGLEILSYNQSLSDGNAVGFNITERDIPPVTGHYYSVDLTTGDARFNGTYECTASTTTTVTLDYGQDVSSYTTTNITGSIGLPSVYNQVEARDDGVWIKNANWSDPDGYAAYWQFGTDGVLSGPSMGGLVVNGLTTGAGNDLYIYASSDQDVFVSNGDTQAQVGFRYLPQVDKSSNFTLELSHMGKHIYNTANGQITLTIPTNASVSLPIGTEIKLVNDSNASLLIDRENTETMVLIAEGQSYTNQDATFYLPSDGLATLLKVSTNKWILSGIRVND